GISWKVANLCAGRRFGSPVRNQIIMFLADKASDDGSGIWCSKGTIQRHTELGETTVKRTINEFLNEGILIETGRRACKNGFTVVYRISLAAVRTLAYLETLVLWIACDRATFPEWYDAGGLLHCAFRVCPRPAAPSRRKRAARTGSALRPRSQGFVPRLKPACAGL